MRTNSIIKFLATFAFLILFPICVFAQNLGIADVVSGDTNAQATPENLTKLISTLSKEELEVLSRLLKIITKNESPDVTATADEGIQYQEALNLVWQDYSKFVWDNIKAFPVAIGGVYQALRKILGERSPGGNLLFAGLFFVVILIGVAAEFAAKKVLKYQREDTQYTVKESSGVTFKRYFLKVACLSA